MTETIKALEQSQNVLGAFVLVALVTCVTMGWAVFCVTNWLIMRGGRKEPQ